MKEKFEELKKQLIREKKKAGLLVLLLAIGLLFWGRLMLKQVPRTATAKPTTTAAATPPASPAAKAAAARADKPEVVIEGDLTMDRDMFALDVTRFLSAGGADTPVDADASGDLTQNDMDFQRAVIREEAGKLQLQSVMLGASPRVMINGRLLGIGDAIDGFKIQAIHDRRVVLEKQGYRVFRSM